MNLVAASGVAVHAAVFDCDLLDPEGGGDSPDLLVVIHGHQKFALLPPGWPPLIRNLRA